jgi:hypothetical protein
MIKGTQQQLRAIKKSLSLRVRKTPGMEMQLQEFPDDDESPASGNDVNEQTATDADKAQAQANIDAEASKAEDESGLKVEDENAEAASKALHELDDLEAENKAIEEAAAAQMAIAAEVKASKPAPKPRK